MVITAERQLRAGARGGTMRRATAMPLRLREELLDGLHLRAESRRGYRSAQEAQAGAGIGFVIAHAAAHRHQEVAPRTRLTLISDHIGAVRIVEVIDRGLCKNIGRAQTAWMAGSALDLART